MLGKEIVILWAKMVVVQRRRGDDYKIYFGGRIDKGCSWLNMNEKEKDSSIFVMSIWVDGATDYSGNQIGNRYTTQYKKETQFWERYVWAFCNVSK